jgi:carboxylesterase type B
MTSNDGAFPHGTYANRLSAIGTDVAFSCRMIQLSHQLNQCVPVWTNEFTEQAAPHDMVPETSINLSTYHSSDVQALLDGPDGRADFTAEQEMTAENIKNYWVAFARNANPNTTGMPAWPQYQDTPGDTNETPDTFLLLQSYPVSVTR